MPYQEEFPIGMNVRIAPLGKLLKFRSTWKLHNRLKFWQLWPAGRVVKVANVYFYHGGDVLYRLKGAPGIWHEQCLETAE
jgi:hypothetical protein